ncbi:uncharacterized protein LOC132543044 [Ylistrum balloti]|uniref:uncharacterized protein LOC132543044 n=1 Tax=Ylistrum balloti TaxID=509963 RepID=UPI002905957E|nr:uncharacterized protein LOC132543044 [Ylistrum balloti]
MTYDLPSVSYMALYVVSMHIVSSNSRSSTGANHWRLNADEGKVVQAEESDSDGFTEDGLMTILTRKVTENGEWRVEDEQKQIPCHQVTDKTERTSTSSIESKPPPEKKKLTCGKPVNYTQYDHLRGIANRNEHSHIPEPEVAMMFRRKGSKTSEIDMNELEERLKKSKKDKPKSVQTHSQIGNFWRIKGNSLFAIECFRKALSISPNNPEVLLYLARVLFNLQYLDDAIFLTRRSLVMQQPNSENSWLQHYTLGEILKAYGHYQEATLHFRHALDLNPGYQPAEAHLREMDGTPNPSVTQYTLFIILFLVLGVIFGVITSIEANFEDSSEVKTQRHFNRAMAMRSIKLGINPRLIRMRKMNC